MTFPVVTNEQPLFSIILFCRNSASTIRRSVESVLNQSYRNIEFVVQDGASTDNTVDILKSYNDPRIKIISEPDSGPPEGFWKALNRCEGEFIGTCLSDDELVPDAIEKAVNCFREYPRAGAITCDGWITDSDGKIVNEFDAGDFNLVDYLFGRYCPFWPGSFFRRQALLGVGLKTHRWTIDCLEFEIWCRLGTLDTVKYVPIRVAKYAVHPTQLSNTWRYFGEHLQNRTKLIQEMFSPSGFFGEDMIKLNGCLYNQLYIYYNHVRAYRLTEQETFLLGAINDLKASIPVLDRVGYREYFNFLDGTRRGWGSTSGESSAVFRRIRGFWIRIALAFPASFRQRLPTKAKEVVRKAFTMALYLAMSLKASLKRVARNRQEPAGKAETSAVEPEFSPLLYHDVAMLYYGRGQIDQALENWRKAEALNDATVDGLACQAMLMSPTATYDGLLEIQKRWADRHARPLKDLPTLNTNPSAGSGKIRIAYFCSFFDGHVFRSMFAPVVKSHDRNRFDVIAYSSTPAEKDIEGVFDEFKSVGQMPDKEFVELVRKDRIDIFVEMSGYSPFHRFSAMASRCAPIQISYFNHTGTSAVPNVDYVLADAISLPADEDKYFTERIWRLEDDFLFFNYDWANLPAPSDPPCLKNGYVTFGCFGSAGKVNDDIIAFWARIMHRVPRSRMYIRSSPLGAVANRDFMAMRFARHGIEAERLRLEGATDWNTFIKSYEDVDITLDTWPYCGANTVAESLWQGVPVITLKGTRFSSRYGTSHVTAAGCSELAGDGPERYIEIASELAAAPERLLNYRRNLRRMALEHGLSDPVRFARKLERAYEQMLNQLPG